MPPEEIAECHAFLKARGLAADDWNDDLVRQAMHQVQGSFRSGAPLSASAAATIILEGVRAGRWRILVRDDAHAVDRLVRDDPEGAYEPGFLRKLRRAGHLGPVVSAETE